MVPLAENDTVRHVRWFHAKAEMECYEEEVLILHQEIKRTQRTFTFLSNVWTSKAESESSRPGYSAFAYERADMYSRMAGNCKAEYMELLKDKTLCHQLPESSKLLNREYCAGTHFHANHLRLIPDPNRLCIVDCLTSSSSPTLIPE